MLILFDDDSTTPGRAFVNINNRFGVILWRRFDLCFDISVNSSLIDWDYAAITCTARFVR